MIDYYDLIRRAVSALDNNNKEQREALYERIRNTLAGILRACEPAPTEAQIVEACLALETAITRVEAPYSFLDTLAHLPAAARSSLRHALDAMHQTSLAAVQLGPRPSEDEDWAGPGSAATSSLGSVLKRKALRGSRSAPMTQPLAPGSPGQIGTFGNDRLPKA